MAWLDGGVTEGGVNPTGTGIITALGAFVPSGPGLKNSVNICGETTSKSLAEGVRGELFGKIGLEKAGVPVVGEGIGEAWTATALVSTEFAFAMAISGEFVTAGRSMRADGNANENVAVAKENRSGAGPICFK